MSERANGRWPLLRLALYLLILGGCGAVAGYELYYAVAANSTTATVLAVSNPAPGQRALRYAAQYEYFDQLQQRHVARAEGVPPTTNLGDEIDVQYLRH